MRLSGHDLSSRANAALGEVEPVPRRPPDPIERPPYQMRAVDATGQDEILDEAADRVVHERRDDGRPHAEGAAQPAGDVVLAATLPGPERPSATDAVFPGVEPQHHLAERDAVPARAVGGRDF